MKQKTLFTLFLLLTLLVLAACNATGGAEPAVDPIVDKVSIENCATESDGTHQLIDAAHGVCFLYPDNYDVFQGEDGSITLYVKSLLNTEAPLATIHFHAVNGRSIQEIIPDYPSDEELATMSFLTIDLGEEMAIVLDNLPGQDINRRIITAHDDGIIDIMIARVGPEYGEVGEQADHLFTTLTDSFEFIGMEPGAPLLAGPECPEALVATTRYTNEKDGYCLLLPDEYTVESGLTSNDGGSETAVYVDSLMNSANARMFITVNEANGRTLEQVTTTKREEIEEILGTSATWSFGYMVDGIPANQFDHVPGQEFSRQVVMVHDGRFITLTFLPDDDAAGDAYLEMEALYELVMDSFSFLWQG